MHERRYLSCRRESDGSVRLNAHLAPKAGEMLIKVLEAAEAQLEEQAEAAENAGATATVADVDAAAAALPASVSAETSKTQFALSSRWNPLLENVSAETYRRSVFQRRADALEHILGQFLAGNCSGPANGTQRLAAFIASRGLAIDAGTARCGWGGERMDYNIAIDALCLEAGCT